MSVVSRFRSFVPPGHALLVAAVACLCARASAQSQNLILNGDFENVVGTGCQSNLTNSAVGVVLPTLTAFGAADETDVYTSQACFGLVAFNGTTKVALSTQSPGVGDGFTFGLSSPILSGTSYLLEFEAHAVPDFGNGLGTLQVGITNDPLSFGTLAFTVTMPTFLVWEHFSTTFTAPSDAQYLSVRVDGPHAWTHVDAFYLAPANVTAFCAGDGTNTQCPCGNHSAVGQGAGCLSSLGVGARLRATGTPSLSADTFALAGDQMTNSSALYFQGTGQVNGGAGALFGDGLRCVSTNIIRLGVAINAAGSSGYPQPGNLPVSVRGMITATGTRYYQVWYRNNAPYCTASGFNFTNGLRVVWDA